VQGISQANSTYRLAWFYWVRLCKAKTAVPKTGINEHRRWVVRDSPLLGWISWLKARLCCGHFALFVAFSIIAFSLTRSFLIRASWSPLSVTRSEHQVYFLLTIIHLLGTLVCTAGGVLGCRFVCLVSSRSRSYSCKPNRFVNQHLQVCRYIMKWRSADLASRGGLTYSLLS